MTTKISYKWRAAGGDDMRSMGVIEGQMLAAEIGGGGFRRRRRISGPRGRCDYR